MTPESTSQTPSPRESETAASIAVLLVDDDPDFADVAATFLERQDHRMVVETRTSPASGIEALTEGDYDCVVSDFDMAGTDGIEFLAAVREQDPDLPFVLFTGKGSEAIASRAISAGVTEYLQKETGTSQYDVLANRIANVVERHRSQQALASSRERLALFVEESPLGVIEWDDDLRFVRVNERAETLLGYAEEELVGEPWHVIVPESAQAPIRQGVADGAEDFQAVTETVRKDGELITCEWHNRVVTDDRTVLARFSLFQDVTDRERSKAALAARRALFEQIAEAASDAIVTLDADGIVRYANPAVASLFGYDPDELVGDSIRRLVPERLWARHAAAFERYLETGERTLDWSSIALTGRHRDGHELPLTVSFSEVETAQGRRFTGIIRRRSAD